MNGGPHGMHPVGQAWVSRHPDAVEREAATRALAGPATAPTTAAPCCRASQADRTLIWRSARSTFWRGFQIGCYTCHDGPDNERRQPESRARRAATSAATTPVDTPVPIALGASDADGNPLTLRIVSQPATARSRSLAPRRTYFPDAGFAAPTRSPSPPGTARPTRTSAPSRSASAVRPAAPTG